jgi:hypothetical protein
MKLLNMHHLIFISIFLTYLSAKKLNRLYKSKIQAGLVQEEEDMAYFYAKQTVKMLSTLREAPQSLRCFSMEY